MRLGVFSSKNGYVTYSFLVVIVGVLLSGLCRNPKKAKMQILCLVEKKTTHFLEFTDIVCFGLFEAKVLAKVAFYVVCTKTIHLSRTDTLST